MCHEGGSIMGVGEVGHVTRGGCKYVIEVGVSPEDRGGY